jgi:hypothetical protein
MCVLVLIDELGIMEIHSNCHSSIMCTYSECGLNNVAPGKQNRYLQTWGLRLHRHISIHKYKHIYYLL